MDQSQKLGTKDTKKRPQGLESTGVWIPCESSPSGFSWFAFFGVLRAHLRALRVVLFHGCEFSSAVIRGSRFNKHLSGTASRASSIQDDPWPGLRSCRHEPR